MVILELGTRRLNLVAYTQGPLQPYASQHRVLVDATTKLLSSNLTGLVVVGLIKDSTYYSTSYWNTIFYSTSYEDSTLYSISYQDSNIYSILYFNTIFYSTLYYDSTW